MNYNILGGLSNGHPVVFCRELLFQCTSEVNAPLPLDPGTRIVPGTDGIALIIYRACPTGFFGESHDHRTICREAFMISDIVNKRRKYSHI